MPSAPVRLRVTLSAAPEPALVEEARREAVRLGVPFVPRRAGAPLHRMLEEEGDVMLVLERAHVSLWDRHGSVRWSPGIAALRLLALERGDPDNLVAAAQLREGDSVLDCTLGLGQDALVAARAVGTSGRVVGIEASPPLHALVSAGLRRLGTLPSSGPVQTVRGDAGKLLAQAAPKSVDVVFFDPMFGRPKKAQPAFEMLRRYAEHAPLTPSMLEEAKRVARRAVVVKAARHSDDLRKLGLSPLPTSRYSAVCWARVDVG